MNYLILQNPGHNRVYYKSADKLSLAELKIASQKLSIQCSNIEIVELESIRYLSIKTTEELSNEDIEILSRLSFVFAIFQAVEIDQKTFLVPIRKSYYEYVDDKISSLLKYKGKTNELFTKMMINVALLSSDFDYSDRIQILDPVAGRGTTLFEGIIYGYDVCGIELESKSIHDTITFFKKFLETERFKHNFNQRHVHGTTKSNSVKIQEFEYARSKDEFKNKEARKKLGLICGNTQEAANYCKKNSFHLIVGDLPYGIAHGNKSTQRKQSHTRNPSELLNCCLSGWNKILKKGGIVVIAWNSFVASKEELHEIFFEHGFDVLSESPYDEFEHMVDKSIKRDIIVAKKR